MKEKTVKSFDFASETTRLIISLSSGIITIILTFNEKIIASKNIVFLLLSVLLLVISIFSGLWVMMALTGALSTKKQKININSSSVRLPSMIQISTFFLTMLFFAIHIALLIFENKKG